MIMSSFHICRNIVLAGLCCLLLAPLTTGPAAGAEKTLHAFRGGSDGREPAAQLIEDADGTLYGTTGSGGGGTGCDNGNAGCGTVFKLTPQGTETVLYAFRGGSDGAFPLSNLVIDGSGTLYGTTQEGGLGAGTVFKLASDGTETVLYAFQGPPDGWVPQGTLVGDGSGNLYGTTVLGGNTGGDECQSRGCGTVFKVAPDGSETVLHAFKGGSDGFVPLGGVILDNQGNLYGTTDEGDGSGCNGYGCGTIFKVSSDGTETALYAFQGDSDGAGPWSNPIIDASGTLYGTTIEGGPSNRGTVFKLAPDGTETVLYAFTDSSDGVYPIAGLVADSAGNLYGTTSVGGNSGCQRAGCGAVFELTPKGNETVLYAFKHTHGQYPSAALLLGTHGELYGTTEEGGKYKDGVVFELKK
ncbi:MAG TPA: choice-of-anchor tandem repeat GloVer-containing protein [Rhizomicrobium sp.]|jgi:uncharacterized repeat protein (TIGR03803 family)|nr:choice-of-anchor tandem repeat GloVer-containing protein [Rhizomicrobium sp.]